MDRVTSPFLVYSITLEVFIHLHPKDVNSSFDSVDFKTGDSQPPYNGQLLLASSQIFVGVR